MTTSYDELARWESRTPGATVRGRRVDNGKPRIHWLSGNGFCGGVYWPMLRELAADYSLVTQDLEGHGDSDLPPSGTFSGTAQVRARIGAVIREQGLDREPLIGMGHSYGGAQTLRLAAENPGLFKALVLLDPILMPPPVFAFWRGLGALHRLPFANGTRKRRDRWANRDEVMARLRGRGIYQGWTEEALACFADYATADRDGGRVLRCPKEIEAEIFEQPVYPWPSMRKIRIPTLFLRGSSSYAFFPAAERMTRRLNPGVTLQQLPGGHCFMQEDPRAAGQAIMTFLKNF